MESRSLAFVVAACAGELVTGSPDTLVTRVCTDSRQAQAGDLFVALKGERFDAHEFLADVAGRGATALLVARDRIPTGLSCAVIAVDNPRQALGQLAARYRVDFKLPIVAVGGSNGKTTTKELLAAVMRQKFKTLWSEASFNNDIGVPLTLLSLDSTHQAAVLEVGTNHPGELAPLVQMVAPDIGVITSIGREHLEFFGDEAGVAAEEGWLAELLPASGKLFVNGDSEWVTPIGRRSRAVVIRVGLGTGNEWRASELRLDAQGVSFRVEAVEPEYSGEYRIGLLGRHQVANALFAIAVGAELKLSRAEIQNGLAECRAPKMRLQLWNWNGVSILDDAYNANADSTTAALQTLRDMPCEGRRVAVLGDMAELGAHAESAHQEAGRNAAALGVDYLFAIGKMAGVTGRAAREAGLTAVSEFEDVDSATSGVRAYLKPGDMILLKASRAARLERLGEALARPILTGKL